LNKLTTFLLVALTALALVPAGSARTTMKLADVAVAVQGGETFTHSDAGVKFDLPKGWKAKPEGALITVSSADDALQVIFWVPDENSFDAAVKELDKELSKTVKNMKTVGKPSKDEINGRPHYGETGTGDVEGATIVWSVDVLGAKKPLIILTFAAPNQFEKNSKGFEDLLSSIKKVG